MKEESERSISFKQIDNRQIINPESLLNCKSKIDDALIDIENLYNKLLSLDTAHIPNIGSLVGSATTNVNSVNDALINISYALGYDIYNFSEEDIPQSMKNGDKASEYLTLIYQYSLMFGDENEISKVIKMFGECNDLNNKEYEALIERYKNGTVLISGEMLKLYNQLSFDEPKSKPFRMTYEELIGFNESLKGFGNEYLESKDNVFVSDLGDVSIEFVYDKDGKIVYENDIPKMIIKKTEMDNEGNYTDSTNWQVVNEDDSYWETGYGQYLIKRAETYYLSKQFEKLSNAPIEELISKISENREINSAIMAMNYNLNQKLKTANYDLMKRNDKIFNEKYRNQIDDDTIKEFLYTISKDSSKDKYNSIINYTSSNVLSYVDLKTAFEATDKEEQAFIMYLYNEKGKEEAFKYIDSNKDKFNMQKGYNAAKPLLETLTTKQTSSNYLDYIWDSILTINNGTTDGVVNFAEGLGRLINHDGVMSANDYKQMYITEYLSKIDMTKVEQDYKNGSITDEQYEFYIKFANKDNNTLTSIEKFTHLGQYQGANSFGRNVIPIILNKLSFGSVGTSLSFASMMGNSLNETAKSNYEEALATTFSGEKVKGKSLNLWDYADAFGEAGVETWLDVNLWGTNPLNPNFLKGGASDGLRSILTSALKSLPKDYIGNVFEEALLEPFGNTILHTGTDFGRALTGIKDFKSINVDLSEFSVNNFVSTINSTFWNTLLTGGLSLSNQIINLKKQASFSDSSLNQVLATLTQTDIELLEKGEISEQEFLTRKENYSRLSNLLCLDVINNNSENVNEVINDLDKTTDVNVVKNVLNNSIKNIISDLNIKSKKIMERIENVSANLKEIATNGISIIKNQFKQIKNTGLIKLINKNKILNEIEQSKTSDLSVYSQIINDTDVNILLQKVNGETILESAIKKVRDVIPSYYKLKLDVSQAKTNPQVAEICLKYEITDFIENATKEVLLYEVDGKTLLDKAFEENRFLNINQAKTSPDIAEICIKHYNWNFLENATEEVLLHEVDGKTLLDKALKIKKNWNIDQAKTNPKIAEIYLENGIMDFMENATEEVLLHETDGETLLDRVLKIKKNLYISKAATNPQIAEICLKYGITSFIKNASEEVLLHETDGETLLDRLLKINNNLYIYKAATNPQIAEICLKYGITNFINNASEEVLLHETDGETLLDRVLKINNNLYIFKAETNPQIAEICLKYGITNFINNASEEALLHETDGETLLDRLLKINNNLYIKSAYIKSARTNPRIAEICINNHASTYFIKYAVPSVLNYICKNGKTILENAIEQKYESLSDDIKNIIKENPKLFSIDNLEMFDSEILELGIPRIVEMAKYSEIQDKVLKIKKNKPFVFKFFKNILNDIQNSEISNSIVYEFLVSDLLNLIDSTSDSSIIDTIIEDYDKMDLQAQKQIPYIILTIAHEKSMGNTNTLFVKSINDMRIKNNYNLTEVMLENFKEEYSEANSIDRKRSLVCELLYGITGNRAQDILTLFNNTQNVIKSKKILELYDGLEKIQKSRDFDLNNLSQDYLDNYPITTILEQYLRNEYSAFTRNQVFKVEDNSPIDYVDYSANGISTLIPVYELSSKGSMIVHVLSAYGKNELEYSTNNYKDIFFSAPEEYSSRHHLATSLISLDKDPVNIANIIFGFSDWSDKSLIFIGNNDIFSQSHYTINVVHNPNYDSTDNILQQTKSYNEYVFDRNDPKLTPSYVVIYDSMTDEVKEKCYKAAIDFNIPIVRVPK